MHSATFLQQLRIVKGFEYFEHSNNTLHKTACFLNTDFIIVIFRKTGKYPIRRDKWNIRCNRIVIN